MHVINKIEEVRKLKKVSMENLAKGIGMSYQGYYKAVKSALDIKVSDLVKIANFLGVSETTFFDNSTMVSEPMAHYGTGDCEKELLQALKELNQVRKEKENLMSELLNYKK